jgi:hypothetical protein
MPGKGFGSRGGSAAFQGAEEDGGGRGVGEAVEEARGEPGEARLGSREAARRRLQTRRSLGEAGGPGTSTATKVIRVGAGEGSRTGRRRESASQLARVIGAGQQHAAPESFAIEQQRSRSRAGGAEAAGDRGSILNGGDRRGDP